MKFLDKILNKLPVLSFLDGYKSYISLGMLIFSVALEVTGDSENAKILRDVATGGLAWGVAGKAVKEHQPKPE